MIPAPISFRHGNNKEGHLAYKNEHAIPFTFGGFLPLFSSYVTTATVNEKVLRGDENTAVRRSQIFFCPTADPLPSGMGRPKFYQLEMVTAFTCKPSLVRIDARNFELSW